MLNYQRVTPKRMEPCHFMSLLFRCFVFGPSRTSRRVLSFAFLPGSARLCVFFSTPVTRIDGLGRRVLCFAFLLGSARLCVIFSTPVTRIDGLGGGGVRVGGGWGGGA